METSLSCIDVPMVDTAEKKRKSDDHKQGLENVQPNSTTLERREPDSTTKKRPKSSSLVEEEANAPFPPSSSSSSSSTSTAKIGVRSALPRFQRTSASSAIGSSSSSRSATAAAEKKRGVTEQSTAERKVAPTPSKALRAGGAGGAGADATDTNFSSASAGSSIISRRLQSEERSLRSVIEGCANEIESKFNQILSNAKTKSNNKWDLKEK